MTPNEAMAAVEAPRFAALTNLASNLKPFLRIAAQQPEVEALARALSADPALALAAARSDSERETAGDAALAIYLWLLTDHRRALAEMVAASVGDWRPLFWTRKVALELQKLGGVEGNRRK